MDVICYIKGKFLPKNQILLDADDLIFTRGYAAYECMRSYHRVPFYLKEHMARLKRTTQELFLPDPTPQLPQILEELIERNPGTDLIFRIYMAGTPTLIVLVDLSNPPSADIYKKGIRVMTTSLSRTIPHAKSTNYTAAMIALKQAEKRGFDDALYVDDHNNLLELTKSNFFAVQDGKLYTAKDQVLYGITRHVVIKIAREHGIEVIEGPISYEQISEFDEAFLTATTKEILRISQIDSFSIPGGNIADELLELFKQHISEPQAV